MRLNSPISLAFTILGMVAVTLAFQTNDTTYQYQIFHYSPGYTEFALSFQVNSATPLSYNKVLIGHNDYTKVYDPNYKTCHDDICYSFPKLTQQLDTVASLTCSSSNILGLEIPLRLLPFYSNDVHIHQIIRDGGKSIEKLYAANNTLTAAFFLPTSRQTIDKISKGIIVMQVDKEFIDINLNLCKLTFKPSKNLKDGKNVDFTPILSTQSPKNIGCDFALWEKSLKDITTSLNSISLKASRLESEKLYNQIIQYISQPDWNYCSLFLNEISKGSLTKKLRYSTNCYEEPFTDTWNADPCCNSELLWAQCCLPKIKFASDYAFDEAIYKGNKTFVKPLCDAFVSPFEDSVTDLRKRSLQLLLDYNSADIRKSHQEIGCDRMDIFRRSDALKMLGSFDACIKELYGNTFGIGNTCTQDSECLTSCNKNFGQCVIPWEEPAPYITECFNKSVAPFIKVPYYWMSNIDYKQTTESLIKIMKEKYTNKAETCVGPVSEGKDAKTCLDEKYCNWKTCSLFPRGSNCNELCTDQAIPANFCGVCQNKGFGFECKDISYPRACIALTAKDAKKCQEMKGNWSPSLQECIIPEINKEADCIIPEFCPPQESVFDDINGFDEKWNRTLCPGGCFDRNRDKGKCIDENCDHACCDRTKVCTDKKARECVCKIDAYCCDNWDETCDRKVVDDGCVNCNCVRRKWEPEYNHKKGLCRVYFTFQERCEDEYYGNATWWIGRTWSEGRFATKERCSEGICISDPSKSRAECEKTFSCEGAECYSCTSKAKDKKCDALSIEECLRCEHGFSTCKVNQTESQCTTARIPCKDEKQCSVMGECNDDILKKPYGACIFPFNVTASGEGQCTTPYTFSILGCIDKSIRDPGKCKAPGQWKEPSRTQSACESFGTRCREVRKTTFDIEKKVVYTYGKTCEQCTACGGTCEPLLTWTPKGVWKKGTVIPYEWIPRKYQSRNIWIKTMNSTSLRVDIDKALDKRITENIFHELTCHYNTQTHVLNKMAGVCKPNATVDLFNILNKAPTTPQSPKKPLTSLPRSKVKLLTKPLYAGLDGDIFASPVVVHVPEKAIPAQAKRLDFNIYLSSMFEYMNDTSLIAKRHGFIDFLDEHGFPKGFVVGDGIEFEFTEAESDKVVNVTLAEPFYVCIEKRPRDYGLLDRIYPHEQIGVIVKSDNSSFTFENLNNFTFTSNDTMFCFNITGATSYFPLSIARNEIPLRIIALSLTVIFLVGFVFSIVRIIYMVVKDKTQIKGFKITSYIIIALCFASYAVQMFFIYYFRLKRTYPDDALLWNTLEWPTRILFSLSVALYIFSKDDETRFKVCDNRLVLWPIFAALYFTFGGFFYYQLYSFFPSKLWSEDFIFTLTQIEQAFIFMIAISSSVMCLWSSIWTCANKDVKSLRIELGIFSAMCLGLFIHIIVWYVIHPGWQGSDAYMIHYVANLCLQVVIMVFMLTTLHARSSDIPFEYVNIDDEYYDEEEVDKKYLKLLREVEDMAKFEVSRMPKNQAKKHFKTLHKKIDKIISDKQGTKVVIERLEDALQSMDDESQKIVCKSLGIPHPIPNYSELPMSIQRGKTERKDELERILADIQEDEVRAEVEVMEDD